MEYEKKYNDLIARINEVKEKPSLCMKKKHHYNGYVETGIRDALDYIVNPETEDERIRKEIVGFIEQVLKDKNVLLLVADRIGDDIPNMIPGWIAYLEKQKDKVVKFDHDREQKPAKWNDVDDKIQRNLMSLLSCMRGDRIAEDTYKKYYPWLRDLPKRFNLQKPAEWSEEEKSILLECISVLQNSSHWLLADKLSSLRPQPHWKSSEQ